MPPGIGRHRGRHSISGLDARAPARPEIERSEEHTSELQSLMRISYAVFCLKTKTKLIAQETVYRIYLRMISFFRRDCIEHRLIHITHESYATKSQSTT